MQHTKGYRDENLFGDQITDPILVALYEIQELGNVNIPYYLMNHYDLTKNEYTTMQRIYNYPNQGTDITKYDITILIETLTRILDGRDFCKWLCYDPNDIYINYIEPFNDAAERLDYSECSVYAIPPDAIALTDPEDYDGTLYAWHATINNTEPIETIPMRVAINNTKIKYSI